MMAQGRGGTRMGDQGWTAEEFEKPSSTTGRVTVGDFEHLANEIEIYGADDWHLIVCWVV